MKINFLTYRPQNDRMMNLRSNHQLGERSPEEEVLKQVGLPSQPIRNLHRSTNESILCTVRYSTAKDRSDFNPSLGLGGIDLWELNSWI